MYIPEEKEDEFELNIVPMIDVIFAILTLKVYSRVCDLFLTSSSPYCRNIWIWTDLRLHHRERVPRRRVRAPLAVAVTIRYHRSYPLLPRT